MNPRQIRQLRQSMQLTQAQFANALGVGFVTVNRWENGQTKPSKLGLQKLRQFSEACSNNAAARLGSVTTSEAGANAASEERLDFLGDANAVRVLVEGDRLSFGHQSNPAFATEISRIDPLPHQRIAVYERMLPQARLRFLLADDAGAGMTIMTGLSVREGLTRRTLRRVLVVAPAGLVGNWQRELRQLFRLDFRIITSAHAKDGNPFLGEGSDLVVVSIDSLRSERLFTALRNPKVEPYDLAVFDEAHKLACHRDPDGKIRATERYRLAEAIAGVRELPDEYQLPWSAHHLLLLTATPHMGKPYAYYALWRLLEPELLSLSRQRRALPVPCRAALRGAFSRFGAARSRARRGPRATPGGFQAVCRQPLRAGPGRVVAAAEARRQACSGEPGVSLSERDLAPSGRGAGCFHTAQGAAGWTVRLSWLRPVF